ncbi:MAG: hypothetical protein ABR585_04575 [Gemmatimonadaceae bacterium]
MLREMFDSLLARTSATEVTRTEVRGIPVVVTNTRDDIKTVDVLARLDRCLALMDRYVPHHFRHFKRDIAGIAVERFACRGAYFHERRICLVELTFTVNETFSDAEVAATILHEAMHARLHALGFPLDMEDRARQERFCRRAEMEFGQLAPDGHQVVLRAQRAIELSDADVAPIVDPIEAARKTAEFDRELVRKRDQQNAQSSSNL